MSYISRCKFLYTKSKLEKADTLKDIFITEDLTPFRIKLFHYVKNECCNKFVMIHTCNRKTRMKKQILTTKTNSHHQDKVIGNWLTVTLPDDLFKLKIDVDFKKLNYILKLPEMSL